MPDVRRYTVVTVAKETTSFDSEPGADDLDA